MGPDAALGSRQHAHAPLREVVTLRPDLDVPGRELGRPLGAVIVAGGLAVLLWLLLPHAPGVSTAGVAIIAVGALPLGGLMLRGAFDRAPRWVFEAMLVIGSIALSAVIYFTGTPASGIGFLYLWATPYAFAYLSARRAAFQTAVASVGYALALAMTADSGLDEAHYAVGRWVLCLGTVIAIGGLVRRLTGAARNSEARFARVFEDAAVGAALVDAEGRYTAVNRSLCEMLGRSRSDLLGRRVVDLTHPNDRTRTVAAFSEVLERPEGPSFEKRCLRRDGSQICARVTLSRIGDGSGNHRWVLAQAEDVTSRRLVEAELARRTRAQEELARLGQRGLRNEDVSALLDEAVESVCRTLGVDLCAVYALDDSGQQLTAVAKAGLGRDIVGQASIAVGSDDQAAIALRQEDPVLVSGEETVAIDPALTVVGAEEAARGLAIKIPMGAGSYGVMVAHSQRQRAFRTEAVSYVQAIVNVISAGVERSAAEQEARRRALHDPLTGLPNRLLALDRLRHALARAPRDGATVAVLLVGLDRFKVINDSFDHATGDEVLQALAPRLHDVIRPSDTIARVAGDEFLVVCDDLLDVRAATSLAERIQAALSRPVALASGEHFLTASIGIAVAVGQALTADDLVRNAGTAMHRAKERGRSRYELFDEEARERMLDRLRIESRLRRAIDNDQLSVAYQPIVDSGTGAIVAVEALARWEPAGAPPVPPSEFIPAAEDSGLIEPLGEFVLRTATRQVADWQRRFDRTLALSVNASGRQINDPLYPAKTAEIVRSSGLEQGTLALEITESVLMEEAESPTTVLNALREHGLGIVLDDFGTGYSSLSYLRRFALDALKIDRGFVAGLGENPGDAAIVEAVIRMAQALRLQVVAEGVESESQHEALRALGCPRLQGYLFGRPLPALDLEARLSAPAVGD